MKTQRRIIIFIIVSVVFHVSLVLFLMGSDAIIATPEHGGSVLAVDLYQENIDAVPVTEIAQISEKPSKVNDNKNDEVSKQPDVIMADKSKIKDSKETQTDVQPSDINNQMTSIDGEVEVVPAQSRLPVNYTQVAHVIEKELTKYFYYPAIAQRRQWQGKVLVEFTIFSTGVIEHVKIRKSSGYSILDNAALDAVKKIKQSEQLSLALNGHQINQVLPVTYKLIN